MANSARTRLTVRSLLLSALLIAALSAAAQKAIAPQMAGRNAGAAGKGTPASFVDPLIGTANEGHVFPGAVLPFGMLAWSPEELLPASKHGFPAGGYAYAASEIRGFSLTHLSGAGCAASGDFLFMPLTHGVMESPALSVHDPTYLSGLSHSREHARAGFYSVQLQNGVFVELTATLRSGAGRFIWPPGTVSTLLIRSSDNEADTTDSSVEIDPEDRTVSGSLSSGDFCGHSPTYDPYYTIYFVAHFDHAFKSYGTWRDAAVTPGSLAAQGGTSLGAAQRTSQPAPGKGSGAYVSFGKGARLEVRVGISYVSRANAEENLDTEDPAGTSFPVTRARAVAAWNKALGRIEIRGATAAQKRVFYTALYHSLLHMNLASDVNGEYRGMDQKTYSIQAPQTAQYANFSGWDVYRSQVQLVTLLDPQRGADTAQSLLNQADQWGCWSRWTHESGAPNVMNGDPSAAAIASIVAFGGTNFDKSGAYHSLLDAATVPNAKRRCSRSHLTQWLTQHYLSQSSRHDSSAADTLELASADFSLSQLARGAGDVVQEQVLLRRAQYWKNLFNPHATPTEGYLQARDSNGRWKRFDPASGDGFVEGTGAQYLWMVPFNERGLFDLLGGNAAASRRLDSFFHDSSGQWALTDRTIHAGMDNEPSIETPWLYDFSGEPYRTQKTVRAILKRLWKPTPNGIPGNDDLGEMSSWYVWATMGMYPVIPGRGEVVLASPSFPWIVIHRAQGDIRIFAQGRKPLPIYVQGLRVNGAEWNRPWLPEGSLLHGGTLQYRLGPAGDKVWGAAASAAPPSFDAR